MRTNVAYIVIIALLVIIVWQNWQASADREYVRRVVDNVDAGTAEILTRLD